MKKFLALSALALAVVTADPASAATVINTTGTTGSTTGTWNFGPAGFTATARGYTYTVAPTDLNNTNQLTSGARLVRSSSGLGVCSESSSPSNTTIQAGSGECPQVDTNGSPNEAISLSFNTPVYLRQLVLNIVDRDDTLRLYGYNTNGTMTMLGFVGGTIAVSNAFYTSTSLGNNSYRLTFTNPVGQFSNFLFTGNNDSADGYRIQSVVADVPELEVWAMMLLGFGLIGLQQRRRRRQLQVVTA
jgi:hypothetical protein